MQEIQGKLQVMINKIPVITIQGKGSLKMDEQEKHQAEKFSCRFYGDFALENNPVTYEDAMKVYATLPKLLGDNGEKAVPVRVWLYPLTKLDSKAARLVREISLTLFFDAQAVLEQLAEVDMRCNDLMKNRIATTFPEIRRKLQQFQALCKQHRQIFQKELAGLLPSIRGGGREEGALVDILTCKNQSPFNTQQLNEFLENKEREVNFVSSYLSALKDVEVVSSKNKVDEIVLDPTNEFVVSFTFTSLQDEEPYLSDLKLWLQTHYMKNTHDPAPASHVSEKPKPKLWFEHKERHKNARRSAKSLSEFAHVNKSCGKTRFLVASVPDEDNPGASVYLYEDGELVNTNFEPPAKPLPPLVAGISHDHVQLTLKPAAQGEAAITGYRVEYRGVGQEDWTAVSVNSKQESFPVAGLCANTEYQFRYAAVSKPGLSVSSDRSETVKTSCPTSPPGKPVTLKVEPCAVTLSWQAPAVTGEGVTIREYRLEYKEDTRDTSPEGKGKWQEQRTKEKAESCSIEGLKPGTSYMLRVSAVCTDGAVSDPSEAVSVSTLGAESRSLAHEYLKKSALLGDQEPSVYALPLEEAARGSSSSCLKYRLGADSSPAHRKVIMVMGATGSGKTTLINGMINYILGVQWEDGFRFKLIHEKTNGSQAESQTSEVTVYEVNYRQGFKIPYSLTIIDTPGFGDVRGIAHDRLIKQIREFLSTRGALSK
ncbi:titin-like [Alligator mississippiensis]|uniref:titin-like n=1 Tax=Alligator mississippiensis TaxID=8496 RepID=UPI0028776FB6|nr:titin-like [Alligator mississippiensis]